MLPLQISSPFTIQFINMRKLFKTALFILSVSFLAGCQDHDLPSGVLLQEDLPLSGLQESERVFTPGSGSMKIKYEKSTRSLSYDVTFDNLTGPPTMGHIHGSAPRGRDADVLIPFSSLPTTNSGLARGVVQIPAEKEEDLLNGLLYVNLHTAQNPKGEIRGQIEFYNQDFIVSKKGLPINPQQAGQTVEPNAIGEMDVSYNKRTKRLSYFFTYKNVPWFLGAFISGPAVRGVDGDVFVPISKNSGSVLIDEEKLKESELLAGLYSVVIYNFTGRPSTAKTTIPIKGQIEF